MPHENSRRTLLAGATTAIGSLLLPRPILANELTPRAAEGPFYPTKSMRMPDTDNDLVKIAGLVREAGGEIITLKGQITDRKGAPMAGARIEIWQCDVNGKYLHPGDDRSVPYDQGFQGFGHDITDDAGNYAFRTIKPTRYPGRTPHIHVKILDGRREVLTTQFYVDGEPGNARDGLYRRMSKANAKAVSMAFTKGPNGPETIVNVVV
ncbi:dioxygenase family protein [Falsiruegeria mediterranea]|uniref:Protocatechuate 3,4-dioxygenase beta chain n=1 Tax=Falsiruegeria mediterranea M17 TaxID=1200281 RepID=A0A2R8C6P0_9RHOB|nr:protocatechuate 3,4-dioxygenase [Falsiruegeria mediterranea]SPJ28104.1 Protocatechuate 3,4-dioxygenase beta chain [Falsiruegeria mediterranea M17]